MVFKVHHVALSVSDIQISSEFYSYFGFKEVACYRSENGEVVIKHLKLGDVILELFQIKGCEKSPTLDLWEDLKITGFRHIAFSVDNIHDVLEKLKKDKLAEDKTTVKKGKTGILYFFIKDPDGNFVEIVQDNRF